MNEFLEKVKKTVFKKNTPLPSDRDVIIQLVSDEMKKLSNKVDYRFKKLEDSQIKVSKTFLKLGEKIMASQQALEAAIAAEKAEVLAAIEAIRNQANPDWDGLIAKVQGIYVAPVVETPVEPLPVEG